PGTVLFVPVRHDRPHRDLEEIRHRTSTPCQGSDTPPTTRTLRWRCTNNHPKNEDVDICPVCKLANRENRPYSRPVSDKLTPLLITNPCSEDLWKNSHNPCSNSTERDALSEKHGSGSHSAGSPFT